LRLAVLVGVLVLLGLTRGLPIVIVILSIVVMIFLHELGHYLAARRAGMKVTEFFIGFGPRIWSFRRGETEFGIKAIPLGAYVRILGMNNLEEVDEVDEPRTYRQAPFRSRFGVAVAGSAMHFAIALVLLVAQFSLIGRPDGARWEVREVTPNSAAAAAGLRDGDRLLSFDGRLVGSFDSFRSRVAAAEPGRVTVVVEREGTERALAVDLSRRVKVIGTVGEDLDLIDGGDGVRIGGVRSSGLVARAGLTEGERVVAVNGTPVSSLDDAVAAVEEADGGSVSVTTAAPDGSTRDHVVDLGSAVQATPPAAFLGVGPRSVLVTDPLPAAVAGSVAEFGRLIGVSTVGIATVLWPPNLVEFVGDTLTGAGPDDATTAPTPAAETSGTPEGNRPMSIVGAVLAGEDLTSENLSNLVFFLVGLNVIIGVVNLIPLLPFDGGHAVIALYEKAQELRRRSRQRYLADVSRMLPVAYGVVTVLAVVFLLSVYLDLTQGVPT
jgi:membrane-associated protease RseP (regulator of RpoE activity)